MPITAKLSREFYERFGDRIVNEVVDLLNTVDEASRSELRRLNELNFVRFDAKLDQRSAEIRAELDKSVNRLDAKIDTVANRLDVQIKAVEERLSTSFAKEGSEVRALLDRRLGEHTRWMIGAWGLLLASSIALWFR